MADLVTVFDADGNAIKLDHVDAREYLATGRYTAAPIDPEQAKALAEADEAVREAAAKVMTAEKDGVDIREALPPAVHAPKAGKSGKARGKK